MANQRLSASIWREHVAQWRGSGLPIDAYAEQSHLAPARLSYWARRMEREALSSPLIPVRVHSPGGAADLQLRSPSGWSLCLAGPVEPAWLAALLTQLR